MLLVNPVLFTNLYNKLPGIYLVPRQDYTTQPVRKAGTCTTHAWVRNILRLINDFYYILLEYCIALEHDSEHVSFGLLYVVFTFPTRIFYRGVPGFATDCPCGVWCRGLTTCPLYVGPLFGNLV